MKRWLGTLIVISFALAACTISVTPNRVEVTPSAVTVEPGASVDLRASVNFDTDSEILWRLGPEDTRSPNEVLSDRTGPTTTYTAPDEDGTYTVIAETVDEASLRGEAKITVDSFLGAERVDATTDRDATVFASNLAPGEEQVLGIDVSSATASAGDALIIELDASLDLSVYDEDRSPYASSSSSDFFAAELDAVSSSALETQAIGVARACRGSCVIRDAEAGTSFVRITNSGSSTANYTLYAYVDDYDDTGEPANDDEATAVDLNDFDQGAIETLGDEDYYRVAAAGEVSFNAPAASSEIAARLRAEITEADGTPIVTLEPGQSEDRLFAGDIIRVYVEGGERAGAAAVSRYVLELVSTQ